MPPKTDKEKESFEHRLVGVNDEVNDLLEDIRQTYHIGTKAQTDHNKRALFKVRLSRIDDTFEKFRKLIREANQLSIQLGSENPEKFNEIRDEGRTLYYEALALDYSEQPSLENRTENRSVLETSSRPSIRLPFINLPSFNGDISEWTTFKDTYQSLIHNNPDLPAIQKFQYLRSALKGSATQAIASIPISETEYQHAWEALIKRYDNKRIQATNHLMKIFNFKPFLKQSLAALENFSDIVLEGVTAFQNLHLEDPVGFVLLTFGLTRLDPKTRERFEDKYSSSSVVPTFQNFHDFIHDQCLQLQTSGLTSVQNAGTSNNKDYRFSKNSKQIFMTTNVSPTNTPECFECHELHRIYECQRFRSLSPQQRFDKVKQLGRCLNCLSTGHIVSKCPSKNLCRQCSKKHHSLLHFLNNSSSRENITRTTNKSSGNNMMQPGKSSVPDSNKTPKVNAVEAKDIVHASTDISATNVLLGTAYARIRDNDGNYHTIRLVIDSGSQRSFITADCAKQLGLPLARNSNRLCGFADSPIPGGKHQVKCLLLPINDHEPQLETNAVVITRISDRMPLHPMSSKIKTYFSSFDLADPQFYKPGQIDFLLGSDLFGKIFKGEAIDTPAGYPSGLKTVFGLIILGPVSIPSTVSNITLLAEDKTINESLENLLLKFWETEEVNQPRHIDPADLECEKHFSTTHQRDDQGRYMIRLPFKDKAVELGDSYSIAAYRFRRLELKLDKLPLLKAEYSNILKDYYEREFISTASAPGKYYLPHHSVSKESTSTKLKIVFDASAVTSRGSLNDKLSTGPKLQTDIREVLLHFRLHRFAFTADIQQTFLQILVHPQDRTYLHFIFRYNNSDAIQEFEFNRLPFGLSCSPFLAMRVLQQLMDDEGKEFPLATEVLQNNRYVDDLLTGADSLHEAHQLQEDLISLLNKGGFQLKKWASNSPSLLPKTPNDSQSTISLSDLEENSIKVLGMKWDPQSDCLSYRVNLPEYVATKRKIMSVIARIYDPLGFLAPVVFKAKSILQDLWRQKLDWDAPIPTEIETEWARMFNQLTTLQTFRIPRHLFSRVNSKVSVIGFSDASNMGYAAVIYLRCEDVEGNISCHLIYAKTRLAPVKSITVPRLELCAAVLLIKSLKFLQSFLSQLNVQVTLLLSDSAIFLSWLKIPLHKLKTFVANRIASILEISTAEQWYHVQSEANMADIASRGITPSGFLQNENWINGPDWLIRPPAEWPISNRYSSLNPQEIPEIKMLVLSSGSPSLPPILEIVNKFSSLNRLLRIISYGQRCLDGFSANTLERRSGPIKMSEMNKSMLIVVKATQRYFFRDLLPLEKRRKSSSLKALTPFVDSHGVIRVGGRLQNSSLSYDQKHPILLPAKTHLTKLIIDHYHRCYLHAGPRLLHSLLRQRFWITSALKSINSRIRRCVTCQRLNSKHFQPLMGSLPSSRFGQGRAFLNTGIDFAGPFLIKDSSRRKYNVTKCYVCLFVCLGTKAIHLEVVSQMTTEAFLSTLDRFIARRGLPSQIFSDNGRNFLGAYNYLKELVSWWNKQESQDQIKQYLSGREIKWSFIPPLAPHFGGLWEAGVKSCKYHLQRVLKSHPLTFEEFSTIVSRIEALLNSRPLYPLSSDPADYDVLTPGHFLIGAPLLSRPEYNFIDTTGNRLSRWQFLQQCIQAIWHRWRVDYLHQLQQRVKWTSGTSTLEPGTLVILREPNVPPADWPTGRILEVYPGKDNIIRVVKLRTPRGEFTRPVTRLAPLLPKEEDQ